MQILFQWEAQGQLLRHHGEQPTHLNNLDIEAFVSNFWLLFYDKSHHKLDRPFTVSLVRGTIASLAEIDALLEQTSTKWKLSRMDAIERAILRLCCYELAFAKILPAPIIINEAVELAKRYANEQSPQFINGILDTINSQVN